MSKSLVSVIIPAYNAEHFIEETVKSVLDQTYTELELIIVNDGSTDGTQLKLDQLAASNSKIQLITKTNSGVCDSRNLGYKSAKGAYITFLDADDLWEPDFLQLCVAKLTKDHIDAVYSRVQLINEKSEPREEYIEANTINSADDILAWKLGYVASMGCAIYKKSVVEKAGAFDNRLSTAADQDFHLRVAAITPIVAIDQVLFYYRIHDNNMHGNIGVMQTDHLLVFQKAKDQNLFKTGRFKRQCYANLYKIIAGSWWKQGNNKLKGIKFIFKSILIYPPIVKKYLS